MYCTRKLQDDLIFVGANDRRLALFENVFPIPRGVSYNAYVLLDDKTVLLDTVDVSVSGQFFENLAHALDGRPLDYVVVNHMEPDHCAALAETLRRYPMAQLVCNAKAAAMVGQFFDESLAAGARIVKEGDTLCTGRHTLTFVMAPMVHWPEAMVTYDAATHTLFSADAFGTFGAMPGCVFADEVAFERDWMADARRYYTNIVGKYGTQVQALLKKAAALDIDMICPLHGPVWRCGIDGILDKYDRWSTYTPEENAVLIAYASVYGGTEAAAQALACRLIERGVTNVALYDVSATHPSVIVAEAFRCSHLVFAATTYNAGIFCNMETALNDLRAHNLQNRAVALIENGSWAPASGSLMRELIGGMKNMRLLGDTLTLRSRLRPEQSAALDALAAAIADDMPRPAAAAAAQKIDASALHRLQYGLFVLTARDGEKDNGCIINTVTQITSSPQRITIAVNRANYTHELIKRTGAFNVSILSVEAPFKLFRHFGFQSGRDVDKFAAFPHAARSANGLLYLDKYACAFLSARVISQQEYETHTVFTAELTEAAVLSAAEAATYAYYHAHIKPQPKPAPEKKKGFVCKICGYVYEGDTLPPDFICPICKHGAEDFEPLP